MSATINTQVNRLENRSTSDGVESVSRSISDVQVQVQELITLLTSDKDQREMREKQQNESVRYLNELNNVRVSLVRSYLQLTTV